MKHRALTMVRLAALVLLSCSLLSCQIKQPNLSLARVSDRLYAETGNEVNTRLRIRGFRNAELAEMRSGLFMEEKYDPKKTPVLLIHGLISDPETWEPLVKSLNSEPTIAANFQFIYYAYPTGTPTVPSAATLKRRLDFMVDEIEQAHQISLERKMIVIGHSMGGILAKSLVSDSGDTLWNKVFTAPLDEFDLEPMQKEFLGEAYFYQPRTYVKKVIFLATPHRGSGRAKGFVGQVAAAFSERPTAIEGLAKALQEKNESRLKPEFYTFLADKVNSVATLRPDSPVTKTLADLPIDPDIEFHSVAGLKNRKKLSGDGVVSLESTFIKGAHCEVGIYSKHNVHQHSDTFELVRTMLLNDYDSLTDEFVVNRLQERDLAFIRYRGLEYK